MLAQVSWQWLGKMGLFWAWHGLGETAVPCTRGSQDDVGPCAGEFRGPRVLAGDWLKDWREPGAWGLPCPDPTLRQWKVSALSETVVAQAREEAAEDTRWGFDVCRQM